MPIIKPSLQLHQNQYTSKNSPMSDLEGKKKSAKALLQSTKEAATTKAKPNQQ